MTSNDLEGNPTQQSNLVQKTEMQAHKPHSVCLPYMSSYVKASQCVPLKQQDALCTVMQVAAIGFCMGAALAVAASQYGKIHAVVGCYGLPQYDVCPVST